MIYGYIRVSTDRQTVDNQRFEIERFCLKNNLKIEQWIEETISGTKSPESLIGETLFPQSKPESENSQTVFTNSEPKSQISETLFRKFNPNISWSHYIQLMRIKDKAERRFYELEIAANGWSFREFQRQYDTSLYERLALSRNKKKVRELAEKGQIIETPQDLFKDPYVLEFTGLPEKSEYTETDLEQKIIDHLQKFLLELGKGFAFIKRQARFTFEEESFFVDLVFYNRLLRCFVLLDLKIGKLRHQDIGQMQTYVNYYDRNVKLPEENPTIGIVLCKDKKEALVEMMLPEYNNQIFASRYQTVLPSKEELRQALEFEN
uniref:Putative cytosolic Protein n=1 Tax=uncultured bacterium contig00109 TaxID=1181574 RepID=A0A806K1X4_9BACT|nr:putative cytosolic Protein [uncultured bacterium contig00109]